MRAAASSWGFRTWVSQQHRTRGWRAARGTCALVWGGALGSCSPAASGSATCGPEAPVSCKPDFLLVSL